MKSVKEYSVIIASYIAWIVTGVMAAYFILKIFLQLILKEALDDGFWSDMADSMILIITSMAIWLTDSIIKSTTDEKGDYKTVADRYGDNLERIETENKYAAIDCYCEKATEDRRVYKIKCYLEKINIRFDQYLKLYIYLTPEQLTLIRAKDNNALVPLKPLTEEQSRAAEEHRINKPEDLSWRRRRKLIHLYEKGVNVTIAMSQQVLSIRKSGEPHDIKDRTIAIGTALVAAKLVYSFGFIFVTALMLFSNTEPTWAAAAKAIMNIITLFMQIYFCQVVGRRIVRAKAEHINRLDKFITEALQWNNAPVVKLRTGPVEPEVITKEDSVVKAT